MTNVTDLVRNLDADRVGRTDLTTLDPLAAPIAAVADFRLSLGATAMTFCLGTGLVCLTGSGQGALVVGSIFCATAAPLLAIRWGSFIARLKKDGQGIREAFSTLRRAGERVGFSQARQWARSERKNNQTHVIPAWSSSWGGTVAFMAISTLSMLGAVLGVVVPAIEGDELIKAQAVGGALTSLTYFTGFFMLAPTWMIALWLRVSASGPKPVGSQNAMLIGILATLPLLFSISTIGDVSKAEAQGRVERSNRGESLVLQQAMLMDTPENVSESANGVALQRFRLPVFREEIHFTAIVAEMNPGIGFWMSNKLRHLGFPNSHSPERAISDSEWVDAWRRSLMNAGVSSEILTAQTAIFVGILERARQRANTASP